MELKKPSENLKTSKTFRQYYGLMLLTLMAAFSLLCSNAHAPPISEAADNLYFYFSPPSSTGGCLRPLFLSWSWGCLTSPSAPCGASSIVGVVLSKSLGYAGLLLGCPLRRAHRLPHGFSVYQAQHPLHDCHRGPDAHLRVRGLLCRRRHQQILDPALRPSAAPGNILLPFTAFLLTYFLSSTPKSAPFAMPSQQ